VSVSTITPFAWAVKPFPASAFPDVATGQPAL